VLQGEKLPESFRKRPVLFSEVVRDVLEYSKANKISFHQDELNAKKLLHAFGDRRAESITPQDIERFLAGRDIKPATQNRYRALLSLVYRKGIENGKVKVNQAKLVKRRIENNTRTRYLLRAAQRCNFGTLASPSPGVGNEPEYRDAVIRAI
jgi:hypothetical protein